MRYLLLLFLLIGCREKVQWNKVQWNDEPLQDKRIEIIPDLRDTAYWIGFEFPKEDGFGGSSAKEIYDSLKLGMTRRECYAIENRIRNREFQKNLEIKQDTIELIGVTTILVQDEKDTARFDTIRIPPKVKYITILGTVYKVK